MMQCYTISGKDGYTHDGMKWGARVTHIASGQGDVYDPRWLHFYRDPHIAMLLDLNYTDDSQCRLWESTAFGRILHDGWLKSGCTHLRTDFEIPAPTISLDERVEFAIRCAMAAGSDPVFDDWADGWLSGSDRSPTSARSMHLSIAPANDLIAGLTRSRKAAHATAFAAELGCRPGNRAVTVVAAVASVRAARELGCELNLLKIVQRMFPQKQNQ